MRGLLLTSSVVFMLSFASSFAGAAPRVIAVDPAAEVPFRHFWMQHRLVLLARTLWDYCRPSRHWLTPGIIKSRYLAVLQGYREALRRVRKGPQFLAREEAKEATRRISRGASAAG